MSERVMEAIKIAAEVAGRHGARFEAWQAEQVANPPADAEAERFILRAACTQALADLEELERANERLRGLMPRLLVLAARGVYQGEDYSPADAAFLDEAAAALGIKG